MTDGRRGLLAAVAVGGELGTAGRLLVAAVLGAGPGHRELLFAG